MSYIPLKVELLEVVGLRWAMRAARLPKKSRSDSTADELGVLDAELMRRLILAGDDHAKAMRGVVIYVELRMQVSWMIEFETYRHGVECLSTSSAMYDELRGLKGVELAVRKQADLPEKVYTRIVMISYQALRNMYIARRYHRHPDWQVLCDFIETLPYFYQLIAPSFASVSKPAS
jgi:hypothetical protein